MPVAHKYLPHYTYQDYCQWEGNWEIIDVIPYAMSPAPVLLHRLVNMNPGAEIREALKPNCKKCRVYMPIDWKIKEDTVLQPDLLVVCDKIEKKYLDFAPILVAEIISPSSAFNDRNLKKEIYPAQKIKYYLILDPHFKKTEVYEILDDQYTPVSIDPGRFTFHLNEECSADVNFADIWE